MILCRPVVIVRSDGLPSDRWRMVARNMLTGVDYDMCTCPVAHASDYDAECCLEAEACLELMLAGDY